METDRLIERLSREAQAIRPAGSPWGLAASWLLGVAVYIALLLLIIGVRPDLAVKLHLPLYLAEIVSLGAVLISCVLSAAVLSFPDRYQHPAIAAMPVLFFVLFTLVMLLAYRADDPPSPPPAHDIECTLCIILYGLLPASGLFRSMRKFASIHPHHAGSVAALASFSVGALILRLNEPTDSIAHVLRYHYLPMAAAGVVGLWLGKKLLRW